MKTGNIVQSVMLPGSPRQVYQALMDARQHARFTKAPAKIAAGAGEAFSCYGGYITGVNVVLKPAKLIVQAWRSQGWPKDYHSIVMFQLAKSGKLRTTLTFSHIGVPAGDVARKSAGWKTHYWEPLKAMFAE